MIKKQIALIGIGSLLLFSGCSHTMYVNVKTKQPGALVYCNNKFAGYTPTILNTIVPGEDKVNIKLCKVQSISGVIISKDNKLITINTKKHGYNYSVNLNNTSTKKDLHFAEYVKNKIPKWAKYSEKEINNWSQNYDRLEKIKKINSSNLLLSDTTEEYFVQPKNIKHKCKIAIDGSIKKTNDLKVYWDGKCKNGYADGIGRAFIQSGDINMWLLSKFRKGDTDKFFILNDNFSDMYIEGKKLNDDENLLNIRNLTQSDGDIELSYKIGKFNDKNNIALYSTVSPFNKYTKIYTKRTNYYSSIYIDYTNDDLSSLKSRFITINKNGIKNGKSIDIGKNGKSIEGFFENDKPYKFSLYSKDKNEITKIKNEIKNAYTNSLNIKQGIKTLKKKYMQRICDKQAKGIFSKVTDYKSICNDINKELFAMINIKIARLEEERNKKKNQIFKQQQLEEQKKQTAAARRAASAAEANARANQEAADDAFYQNLNRNIQLQQQNYQIQRINSYIRYGY